MLFPWAEVVRANAGGDEETKRGSRYAELLGIQMGKLTQGELVIHAMTVERRVRLEGFNQRSIGG